MLQQILDDFRDTLARDRAWRKNVDYRLNRFWGTENSQTITEALTRAASSREAIQHILRTELYAHHVPRGLVDKSVDWHIREYRRLGVDVLGLDPAIQESDIFPPEHVTIRQERRYSPDFFRHLYVAVQGTNMVGGLPRPSVLELGAGNGTVAAIFHRLAPHTRYFICDIPETLVFARLYLATEFPDARILWAHSEHELLEATENAAWDFVLLPTMLAPSLHAGQFDVFMNFHSMGEFDNTATRFWMRWLHRESRPRQLLMCNRYLNIVAPGIGDWRFDENQASVLFDSRWIPITWELEPSFLRCPYTTTLQSRCLLLAAKDGPVPDDMALERDSVAALEAAAETNSVRLLNSDRPTSYHRAMLRHDVSMEGPLFNLWNSIRLHESVENLALLLQYLGFVFPPAAGLDVEERPYYVERLRRKLETSENDAYPDVRSWLPLFEDAYVKQRRRPEMVESYEGYNLLKTGQDELLAVAQGLGPVDLFTEFLGEREVAPQILRVVTADADAGLAELRQRVDRLVAKDRTARTAS